AERRREEGVVALEQVGPGPGAGADGPVDFSSRLGDDRAGGGAPLFAMDGLRPAALDLGEEAGCLKGGVGGGVVLLRGGDRDGGQRAPPRGIAVGAGLFLVRTAARLRARIADVGADVAEGAGIPDTRIIECCGGQLSDLPTPGGPRAERGADCEEEQPGPASAS